MTSSVQQSEAVKPQKVTLALSEMTLERAAEIIKAGMDQNAELTKRFTDQTEVVARLVEALGRAETKLHVYAKNHADASQYGTLSDKEYWQTIKPMVSSALAFAREHGK